MKKNIGPREISGEGRRKSTAGSDRIGPSSGSSSPEQGRRWAPESEGLGGGTGRGRGAGGGRRRVLWRRRRRCSWARAAETRRGRHTDGAAAEEIAGGRAKRSGAWARWAREAPTQAPALTHGPDPNPVSGPGARPPPRALPTSAVVGPAPSVSPPPLLLSL